MGLLLTSVTQWEFVPVAWSFSTWLQVDLRSVNRLALGTRDVATHNQLFNTAALLPIAINLTAG